MLFFSFVLALQTRLGRRKLESINKIKRNFQRMCVVTFDRVCVFFFPCQFPAADRQQAELSFTLTEIIFSLVHLLDTFSGEKQAKGLFLLLSSTCVGTFDAEKSKGFLIFRCDDDHRPEPCRTLLVLLSRIVA